MKPIDSTYEILAFKHLNRNVDKKWIDWAVDMMIAGIETESLIELAGISEPYNQFELKQLTDNVFSLHLHYWHNILKGDPLRRVSYL